MIMNTLNETLQEQVRDDLSYRNIKFSYNDTVTTVKFLKCQVIPKTIIKMIQTASLLGMNAPGLVFGSAARLSKRLESVWNCLWGQTFKRDPGIICKSRVFYPGPGFISSATCIWHSLSKKQNIGLINQSLKIILIIII